jgi:hypothetical protein
MMTNLDTTFLIVIMVLTKQKKPLSATSVIVRQTSRRAETCLDWVPFAVARIGTCFSASRDLPFAFWPAYFPL